MQSSISGGNFDYGGQGSEGMTKFYSAVKNSKYPEYASVQNFMQRTTLNPFDALAGIFNEVPLIDITTHNINLKVPLLASEDIIRYASLSDAWLERNGRILDDWKNIFQSFLGTCSSL